MKLRDFLFGRSVLIYIFAQIEYLMAALFFFICLLFQLLLLTHWPPIYRLSQGLFFLLLLLFIYFPVKKARQGEYAFLAIFLSSLLLRLPFFFFPRGLIFTSDNALDALQSQQIAATHQPPFFLFGALRHHMGTIKYFFASFFMDVFGPHYLFYTLTQVLLYVGLLFFLYWIAARLTQRNSGLLLVLFLSGFSFIETALDNSLSLRAGSEFEMAFFFLLGAALFDFTSYARNRIFLAAYFFMLAVYLHLLALALMACFLAAAVIISLRENKGKKLLLPIAGGIGLGFFHWGFYLLFVPKPPLLGGWEALHWRWPAINLSLFLELWSNLKNSFLNIFRFETSYLLDFFSLAERGKILFYLNQALVIFSLICFLLSIILSIKPSLRLISSHDYDRRKWPYFYFLLYLLAFAVKCVLFQPPLLEPRHNFDLLLLLMLAFLFVFSFVGESLRWKKIFSFGPLLTFFLLLLFTAPHYYLYWRMAQHKEQLYDQLMPALQKNRVQALTTDFILAYPIHFLSGRKILVSDSLGPLTIPQFFPEMREQVDRLPEYKKAYLFFAPEFPARPWHKEATAVIKTRLLDEFKKKGINWRTQKVDYLVLILPKR